MSGDRREPEPDVEDLAVPAAESANVKGGVAVGDVNGDTLDLQAGDPDQPIIAGKLPGLHKSTDVTLKRG